MKKTLILVDGSSYLFRAYHALPLLKNSKGVPTGAIYGVISMIRKMLNEYHPDYVAVVFDAKGKTFRHELFPDYKAHRPRMPEDLQAQILPIHAVIQAFGLPLISVDGVEADDVIGTLAQQAMQSGLRTLISSSDKDFAQLVTPDIELINTMTNQIMDSEGVVAKFGVPPAAIIDYLALVGDSADNIPGIPKVGPKTAAEWLKKFNTLDSIIAHADEFPGKLGENLRTSLVQLPLAKQLVTIKCDVPLPIHPTELVPSSVNTTELIRWFTQLEFRTWLEELVGKTESPIKNNYTTIVTEADFNYWLTRLKEAEIFSFNTETTGLDPQQAELVGLSFAIHQGEAAYLPLAHRYLGVPEQLNRTTVLAVLQPLLNDPNKTLVGRNIKYDKNVLANYDITINAACCDIRLESYILNSTGSRHDMASLALKYLGYKKRDFETIAGKGRKQLVFSDIALEKAAPYAAEEADITLQLHNCLWPHIAQEPGLTRVYQEIEMPLVSVLAKMEQTGVLVDADYLSRQSQELAKQIHKLEKEVFSLAGEEFSINSTKQLQTILYEKLQIPVLGKTPKGAASTAESVLQELALQYELPGVILAYRSCSKLKSTYTDALPKAINPKTGRVHTSYNQTVTSTGRLSSAYPNLQNIPVRAEAGRKIRQAFIAPPGYKIVSGDYSQIELRIMAHLSQDPGLLNAFAYGLDVHRSTAAELFGIPLEKVTAEERQRAKAINFGLIYGMSAFGLAQQLGIERQEAQQHMAVYFERYPGVQKYREKTCALAAEQGYVETLLGRRLYVSEINAANLQRRRAAERAAINAPIQGTAADIIKLAMIAIHHWLVESCTDARMIMQVHDELVFEVPNEILATVQAKVKKYMETTYKLSVPLVVEFGQGANWDEAHSLGL